MRNQVSGLGAQVQGSGSSSSTLHHQSYPSAENSPLETQPLSAARLPAQVLSQARSRHDLKQLLLHEGLRG